MDAVRTPRPEHEVLAAAPIAVTLGGREKMLPPLSIRANRTWKAEIARAVGTAWVAFGAADDYDAIVGLVSGLTDEMVDLLVAYDAGGVLGGREWIEDNATDAEVYAAMKEVLCVAYPPFRDARGVPGLAEAMIGLLASVSQERTSSSRPSGAASRPRSTKS